MVSVTDEWNTKWFVTDEWNTKWFLLLMNEIQNGFRY